MPFLGEFAALAVSVFFSIGPIFFTLGGRLLGSVVVNRTRLLVGTLILLSVHFLLYGQFFPTAAQPYRWFWLALSGLIGLTLGDAALFQAFVQIGARPTMLIFSLSPVLSAILAWLFLGESLAPLQLLGIAITVSGVIWVVAEGQGRSLSDIDRRNYLTGLGFAFLGGLGQSAGLVTAKFGLDGDFPALSGQVIRMLAATLGIWLIALAQRQVRSTIKSFRANPLAARYVLFGAISGPVIGVYFSLVAIQFAPVGIASTLMALPPIFLIPIDYIFFKEKVSWRAILGTLVALSGVAILFLI